MAKKRKEHSVRVVWVKQDRDLLATVWAGDRELKNLQVTVEQYGQCWRTSPHGYTVGRNTGHHFTSAKLAPLQKQVERQLLEYGEQQLANETLSLLAMM